MLMLQRIAFLIVLSTSFDVLSAMSYKEAQAAIQRMHQECNDAKKTIRDLPKNHPKGLSDPVFERCFNLVLTIRKLESFLASMHFDRLI